MRIPDHSLQEVRDRGFTLVPGFLTADEVAAAREGLWQRYPKPERFFPNPDSYPDLLHDQFGGLRTDFPLGTWGLNRLPFHEELVRGIERYFRTTDIRLYKVETWAKYAGACSYAQPHHRDFGNHTLVVPREDGFDRQLNTVIFLSDVTEADAPTKLCRSTDRPTFPW